MNILPTKPTEISAIKVSKKSAQFKFAKPKEIYFKKKVNSGISWSYVTGTTNNLVHAITGNMRLGYRVAVWNCRRGLLTPGGSPSCKVTDIQLYLEKHQIETFGVIESDLHGANSRQHRIRPLSTQDIESKLKIEGYYILLLQSWYNHAQARIYYT